ncbi:uncharacterized protein LOC114841837 [Betta splendens]|uniref:Uncharacterized protein LOC114841837 n=1 Tax=Betta splendens TaxID=158456 RepID=A0A6P7KJW7_BETSP|nr:uncharacterized protein LOC114841837 [Betta splendens]
MTVCALYYTPHSSQGTSLPGEEKGLPKTSPGAAEPTHCTGPCRDIPPSRGSPCTVTTAVSGTAGVAVRPVRTRTFPLACGERRRLYEVLKTRTSSFRPSSWPEDDDDDELAAASQAVEDRIKSQKSHSRDPLPLNSPSKTSKHALHPPDEKRHSASQNTSAAWLDEPESTVQPTEAPSTSQGGVPPLQTPLSDLPVELDGWVRLWEKPDGIPSADIHWLKEDTTRGMFTAVHVYKDNTGVLKRRRVMASDRMWFYPPEPPAYVGGVLPGPQLFFRSRLFVWRPVGVWRCSLKCPRGDKCVGAGKDVHLYKSGYHHRV